MAPETWDWEIEVTGLHQWLVKDKYQVAWRQVWQCDCPHMLYRRPPTCKHISEVIRRYGRMLPPGGLPVWWQASVLDADSLGYGYQAGQLVYFHIASAWAIVYSGRGANQRTVGRGELESVVKPVNWQGQRQASVRQRELWERYFAALGAPNAERVAYYLDGV